MSDECGTRSGEGERRGVWNDECRARQSSGASREDDDSRQLAARMRMRLESMKMRPTVCCRGAARVQA